MFTQCVTVCVSQRIQTTIVAQRVDVLLLVLLLIYIFVCQHSRGLSFIDTGRSRSVFVSGYLGEVGTFGGNVMKMSSKGAPTNS
jgi:uncharacterized integral membrane protein